jgi:hypothetical protein
VIASIWRAEQVQHREISETVAAVRRWVDHDDASLGEDHIARPKVTVDAGRRALVVELASGNPFADPLHEADACGAQVADPPSLLGVRQHPLVRIEPAPGGGRAHHHGLPSDVAVPAPTGRG